MKKIIIFVFLFFSFSSLSFAQTLPGFVNPALEHCEKVGGEYVVKNTDKGQAGVCKINEDKEVRAWDFMAGLVETEENYCSQKGFDSKVTSEPGKCNHSNTRECVLCVLANGEEIEMAKIIADERGAAEKIICVENGRCEGEETAGNCPEDCLLKKPVLIPVVEKEKKQIKQKDPEQIEIQMSVAKNTQNQLFLFVAGFVFVVFSVLLLAFILIRKRDNKPDKAEYPESFENRYDIDESSR